MNKPRVSILGVMGIIMVAAVVLALVRAEFVMVGSGLEGWANVAHNVAVSALVIATYLARYRKGKEADWWFGFALGGWSYYLFSADMVWQWARPNHVPNSFVQRLPYTIVNLIPRNWMDKIIMSYSFLGVPETRSYVTCIVQALVVFMAAFAGGCVCSLLSWRRRVHSDRLVS